MSENAAIVSKNSNLYLYLHWYGEECEVRGLLEYCRDRGFRTPDFNDYGWARLCQVAANYVDDSGLGCGIGSFESLESLVKSGFDNGIYVIDGWDIIDRKFASQRDEEVDYFNEADPLAIKLIECEIDSHQPPSQQLGSTYLLAREVERDDLELGDRVFMRGHNYKPVVTTVIGLGCGMVNGHDVTGVPYTNMYAGSRDNPPEHNIKNYILNDKVRLVRRAIYRDIDEDLYVIQPPRTGRRH